MKVFGYEFNRIENKDVKKPKSTALVSKINKESILRTRQDIADWKLALDQAESKINPQRKNLIDVYKEVILDCHVSSIIESLQNKIKARHFCIKFNDEMDEEKTNKFAQTWFYDFLTYALEADFWGYSLVEFDSIIDDVFSNTILVPRDYVEPSLSIVKRNRNDLVGIPFDLPPYDRWTVFVGSQWGLGLLNKATPHAIAKKNLLRSCWNNAELFGMPLRVGKTDMEDSERRKNMEYMLKNMGSAAWGLLNEDDEVEYTERSNTDAFKIFLEPIRFSNEEISKAFAGQTMMFDDGSSRSQSEVHERLFEEYILSYVRKLTAIVNNQLLPILKKHSDYWNNCRFEFTEEEKITLDDKVKHIEQLGRVGYKMNTEQIKEVTGYDIEEIKEQDTLNAVHDLYKGYFDNNKCC